MNGKGMKMDKCEYDKDGHCLLNECMYGDFLVIDDSTCEEFEKAKKRKEMNNMTDCCSEMTLEEEIKDLEIDKNVKERLLGKYRIIEKELGKQYDYLCNCHNEIDRLNRAIVSQAKMIGNLEEEIKNRGIRCN